ncbi:hypothetical protein J2S70_001151 [Trueperella bonasi]|uniref:Uncharacterized protein n=1 Tax=Trueperella bonasi TaxID=312286 RepID=A0ABT9NGN6_9ACTO|nr:hypothetical protein [Trueperella bonasi]
MRQRFINPNIVSIETMNSTITALAEKTEASGGVGS